MARALLEAIALAALICGSAAGIAAAGEGDAGRTPTPHPPKGQGEHCVADTAFMRRYHMTMLVHHRTEAVHAGVRTAQYDLTGCISCHAVRGADGRPVSYADSRHFCRSCHDYAAVSLDCFECHASRPDEPGATAAAPSADRTDTAGRVLRDGDLRDKDLAALSAYAREINP